MVSKHPRQYESPFVARFCGKLRQREKITSLEVASIAFVWSPAQPPPAFHLFAGHCPTPLVGAKSAPFGTPYGSGIPNYAPLRLLSKRNPLALGFRLVLENDYFGGNDMKKDIKFSTRMASADREAIKELAKRSGMSMSDYVTACCLGKQVLVIDGLKEVLKELKSIGRNLNQLVTLAHMGRVTVINLDSVRQAFSELCAAVRLILERKRW